MTISNVPPDEAIIALEAGLTRVVRRVEIYESDAITPWVPDNQPVYPRLVDGNVTLDFNRNERRMLDLVLDNADGKLTSVDGEGFWYDKILKVYRGVRYNVGNTVETWEVQMGEFYLDKIDTDSSGPLVKVSARDPWKKLMNSKLTASTTFPSGTLLHELVRAMGANAGITKFKIAKSNETIGTRIDLERGTERGEVIKQACNSNNYDVYFDNEGYLVMEKYSDPVIDPALIVFKTGPQGNLVDYSKSVNDSRLYNHIAVYGDRESVEGGDILLPYFGEAKNEDSTSPTSIDRIGDRYYSYASSFFTSDQQCLTYAKTLLKIHSLESYELNWSSIYYPHLEVGRVVEVEEPEISLNENRKFLLDTINYPLALAPMSATGKRVLIVG